MFPVDGCRLTVKSFFPGIKKIPRRLKTGNGQRIQSPSLSYLPNFCKSRTPASADRGKRGTEKNRIFYQAWGCGHFEIKKGSPSA
ncbi:MAG: hypothetical protein BM485_08975 [Desulfobulbaceae bacterium DB1]|nr:MAG: hypothetical protein BM485_08975 [Desulfobulbaceae bacterium DB1]